MFSTVDGWGNRHLQAFAIRPGIRRELAIPPTLDWLTRNIRAFPSEANLRVLASKLADEPTPDTGPLEAIEVNVWIVHYDPTNLTPASSLLHSLRVPFDEH
jgi:hypothetical protein